MDRSHPGFTYQEKILCCEGVPLDRLAKRFGTPLYVYSENRMVERLRVFDSAFASIPHTVCYSVKANPNLTILSRLASSGAGFDVVSGGELLRVEKARHKALKKTVFSGVGKTRDELHLALKKGIFLFNVESEDELEELTASARRLGKDASVALRVNPDVPADTHPYISTGLKEHKFGVSIADAIRLYQQAARSKRLSPVGVSVHIGSQITDLSAFRETMKRVADVVLRLRALGIGIRIIDAGGGLGIDYAADETLEQFRQQAAAYAEAIVGALQGLGVHLVLEPGRAIVGRAGVLVTKVLYVKQNGAKRFAVVDGAMNDLIRPALYHAEHRIVPVRQSSEANSEYEVVGPICESSDFLGKRRALPNIESGDWLAVLDAGAYGMSLASNYNSRPRAAEVLVDRKSVRLIRKRESPSDLWRMEA